MATSRMEQYVNNSQVLKLEIAEVEEYSLGLSTRTSMWNIFLEMRQGKAGAFLKFSVSEKKANIYSQASGDGMTAKAKKDAKRERLEGKPKP